jgi:hypothetical protein
MIQKLIKDYGTLMLVLLFLLVNIALSKINNIITFLVSLLLTYFMFKNKIYAVLVAYVITIGYGIVKNFHLLENFTERNDILIKKVKERKQNTFKFLKIIPNFKQETIKINVDDLKLRNNPTKFKNMDELKLDNNTIKEILETGHVTMDDFIILITTDNFVLEGDSIVKYAQNKKIKNLNVYKMDYKFKDIMKHMSKFYPKT